MSRRKRGRRQGWDREKMERETGVGERNRDWRKRDRVDRHGRGRGRKRDMSVRKKTERKTGCEGER